MKFVNPYQNIHWETVHKIQGATHAHCKDTSTFLNLYNQGIRHMSLSNYRPSAPVYPLDSCPDFAAVLKDDMIGCPNAEHHSMTVSDYPGGAMPLHITAPGSTFVSGSPQGQQPDGVGDTWQYAFEHILKQLIFPDGGGVIINHPDNWFRMPLPHILNFLDFDKERVLGIEIYNDNAEREGGSYTGWALTCWDNILITGRRCWGFAVPDHSAEDTEKPFKGRSVLLVDNATEYDCLRAYRTGAFYAKCYNTNLAFRKLFVDEDNQLVIETENAARIDVIADGAVRKTAEGNRCIFDLSQVRTYCRVEAHSEEDSIFSNPIMID